MQKRSKQRRMHNMLLPCSCTIAKLAWLVCLKLKHHTQIAWLMRSYNMRVSNAGQDRSVWQFGW